MLGLPFGGFFLKLIGAELIKGIAGSVFRGQVTTVDYNGPQPTVGTKHWVASRTMWGALAVILYAVYELGTGGQFDTNVMSDLLHNSGNIFLFAAGLLTVYGRTKL